MLLVSSRIIHLTIKINIFSYHKIKIKIYSFFIILSKIKDNRNFSKMKTKFN